MGILGGLSIKQRLLLFLGIMCGLQSLTTFMVFSGLLRIEHHVADIADTNMPAVKRATAVTELQLTQETAFERAFRYALEMGKEAGAEQRFSKNVATFNAIDQEADSKIADLRSFLTNANTDGKYQQYLSALSSLESDHKRWADRAGEAFQLMREGELSKVVQPLTSPSGNRVPSNATESGDREWHYPKELRCRDLACSDDG